ncbi:tetratricopeptide (TPR) repeat protein [Kitasatospora gansuensis]|uniref:Tetratricopeptide (TPR) repeat protein n=1 Tax=Kitasatospora gansuensis TaxID=258050 RepID=A0A7W7SIJ6_9ACTN|nr:tetratricopeptide repeat protein [Kitasatospora gansuensis]MBB4950752.1 tetratricopeptide (TPR) repeat protein [Kitasatospora gansuensis]
MDPSLRAGEPPLPTSDWIRNLIDGQVTARDVIQAGRIDQLTVAAPQTGRIAAAGLPARSRTFAGRAEELAALLALLAPDDTRPPPAAPAVRPERTLPELMERHGLVPWPPPQPSGPDGHDEDDSGLIWEMATPDGRIVPIPDNLRMFAVRSPSGQLLPIRHALWEQPGAGAPAGPAPEPDPASVVLVTGPAGIGKTELALQAAHLARAGKLFPGGELFVDLHGYRPERSLDPVRALGVLLVALGVSATDLPAGEAERAQLYRSLLAERAAEGRPTLVLLDNAASAGQVEPLLPGDGLTRVIVTSRHSFAPSGAQLLELAALDGPAALDVLQLTVRAVLGKPDGRFAREPEAAAELTWFCQNLPVALRMLGALIAQDRDQPLHEVVAELADLGTLLDDIADDEQTLRALIELSYRQLPADQARLLRLLALPGGPVGITDAATLNGTSEKATRKLLRALVSAHLVESGGSQETRWSLPLLTELFVLGLPGEHTEAREALTRLTLHWVDTVHAVVRDLTATAPRAGQPVAVLRTRALQWLDDNWTTAFLLAGGDGPPDLRLLLCHGLESYLERRHLIGYAVGNALVAVQIARELPTAELVPEVAAGMPFRPVLRDALNSLGAALLDVRQVTEAITCFEEAIASAREDEDLFGEAQSLTGLGQALSGLGRLDETLAAYRRAVRLLTGLDRPGQLATVRAMLGRCLLRTGEPEEALREFRALLALPGRKTRGEAELGIAEALSALGRPTEAIATLRTALDHHEHHADERATNRVRIRLGEVLIAADEPAEAVEVLKLAELTASTSGDHRLTGRAWLQLARAFRRLEQPDRAVQLLRNAAGAAVRPLDAELLVQVGNAHLDAEGELPEAVQVVQAAAACLETLGDLAGARALLTQLADGLADSHDDESEDGPEVAAFVAELRAAERAVGRP